MRIEIRDYENENDADFLAELVARTVALYFKGEDVEVTIHSHNGRWQVTRNA